MMSRQLTCIVLSSVLALPAAGVHAHEPRFGSPFTVMVGGMPHKATGSVSATLESRPKRTLKIKDLGLDDRQWVFWGSFDWRFAERWELGATYTDLSVSGLREFQSSGNFEEIEWDVSASLESSMKIELYIVDVSWDFLKTESAHIGVGAGLHVADAELAIAVAARASVEDQAASGTRRSASTDVTAPLLNMTLDAGWTPHRNVYLSATLGYLDLKVGDYDGRLLSARATAEWRPTRRLGLGAGFQHIDIDLDVERSNRGDQFRLKLSGPILFLSYGF